MPLKAVEVASLTDQNLDYFIKPTHRCAFLKTHVEKVFLLTYHFKTDVGERVLSQGNRHLPCYLACWFSCMTTGEKTMSYKYHYLSFSGVLVASSRKKIKEL